MDKRLSIIRHAKSDWPAGRRDFDRAINKRGISDARLIGNYLHANGQQFDKVYCSKANRAKLTLEQLNAVMKFTESNIRYEQSLYLASLTYLLSFIEQVSNDYNNIALIAHNPGLTNLCNYLTGDQLNNLPTCGVYTIQFCVDDWKAIGLESGVKKSLVTPKMIKYK